MLGVTLGGLIQAEIETSLFLLRPHAFELAIVCCNAVERVRCLRVASRLQAQPECVADRVCLNAEKRAPHAIHKTTSTARTGTQECNQIGRDHVVGNR